MLQSHWQRTKKNGNLILEQKDEFEQILKETLLEFMRKNSCWPMSTTIEDDTFRRETIYLARE